MHVHLLSVDGCLFPLFIGTGPVVFEYLLVQPHRQSFCERFDGLRYIESIFHHLNSFFELSYIGVDVFPFHSDAFLQTALCFFFRNVVCKSSLEGGCHFIPQPFVHVCYSSLELLCQPSIYGHYPFINMGSFDVCEEEHSSSIWIDHKGVVIVYSPIQFPLIDEKLCVLPIAIVYGGCFSYQFAVLRLQYSNWRWSPPSSRQAFSGRASSGVSSSSSWYSTSWESSSGKSSCWPVVLRETDWW